MSTDAWAATVVRPMWALSRIVRSTRRALEPLTVDARLLRSCAHDQQGLLIDRCACERAAAMLEAAGQSMVSGIAYVIAATERDHHIIMARARRQELWLYDGDRHFRDAGMWVGQSFRLLLTSVGELRAVSRHNLRRRSDWASHFCPLVAIVDPELSLCERPRPGWDPAWVVRDLLSRICASQQMVAVVLLTAREHATISPSTVQRSFGLSGLLYCDGASAPTMVGTQHEQDSSGQST